MDRKPKQDRGGPSDRKHPNPYKHVDWPGQRKQCHDKNQDLEGIVMKVTKEHVMILAQEHYRVSEVPRDRYGEIIGPEPYVIKYKVDSYLKVRTRLEKVYLMIFLQEMGYICRKKLFITQGRRKV